ncbi:hypothetical protein GCM10009654_48340 [Streptomyces hebeiensis]|uniref:Major facilitator superfamily (MFS) profile domain-containing protein n=1 Tax=Streptomyces hebeiensis TaxID=229486 RepID=A0ABN1V219_9ACTN
MIAESRFYEACTRYPRQMPIVICAGAAENAGYYIFGTFSVAYAEDRGLPSAALPTGISIAAGVKLVSLPVFGALSDRVGRRPVTIGGSLVLLLAAWPFFRILDGGQPWAIWPAMVIALSVGQAAILGSQPAFFAELFDTKVRFSAVGVANNVGTVLTGGLAPLFAAGLLLLFDHDAIGVVVFMVVMSALTIVTVALARDTRPRPRRKRRRAVWRPARGRRGRGPADPRHPPGRSRCATTGRVTALTISRGPDEPVGSTVYRRGMRSRPAVGFRAPGRGRGPARRAVHPRGLTPVRSVAVPPEEYVRCRSHPARSRPWNATRSPSTWGRWPPADWWAGPPRPWERALSTPSTRSSPPCCT